MGRNTTTSVGDIFLGYYTNILQMMKGSEYFFALAFELLPVMYVLCDVATSVAKKDRKAVSDEILHLVYRLFYYYDMKIFDRRVNLYSQIINGKPIRYDWLGIAGASSNTINNTNNITPEKRCIAVLCDILYNPPCADDYDNAPVQLLGLSGLFRITTFADNIMIPLSNELSNFFGDIFRT